MLVDADGVTVPLMMQDRPLARTLLPLRWGTWGHDQPILAATWSSSSCQWASSITSPVALVSPLTSRFFLRSSYGSQPRRWAIISIWVSYAQAAWLMP